MSISFTKTTHPIDFSNLSGHQFERLVFATLLRMRAWHSLSWHGQTGSDGGRDIVGVCDNEYGRPKTVVVACANWKKFTLAKATGDIDSFVNRLSEPPSEVIVVAGGSVSAEMKEKIAQYAGSKNIAECQTWSSAEFEEFLRFHAPSVLDRFFHGVELPDEEQSLREFVYRLKPATGNEAAEMLANLFDRPAFTTRMKFESSLPAFRQAIGDTIGALNTGIWRDREGAIISRVPMISSFSDSGVVKNLKDCVSSLVQLRIMFDQGLRDKMIKPCGCDVPDCPVFEIEPNIGDAMEIQRAKAIKHAQKGMKLLRANAASPCAGQPS